ncbi:MAG: hypothetical protein V9G08_15160 [Dermatophilaceae bacterium]
MASASRLRLRRRLLPRGPDSVQFGIDAGVVLGGLSPGEQDVLNALTLPRTYPQLYAVAARHGIPGRRVDRLVAVLLDHDLLGPVPVDRLALAGVPIGLADTLVHDARLAADSASTLADRAGADLAQRVLRRHTRRILVDGTGGLATDVADGLRRAGVGDVRLGTMAADDLDLSLRSRDPVVADDPPALVVLVAADALEADRADPWWRRGIPHLPVVSEGARVSVGPLVGPWRDGACLRCLDLHRADVDPAWPSVLASAAAGRAPGGRARTDTTLSTTVAGVVAMLACGVLDGRPVPAGVALEVSLPFPRLDHRRWERHPRCGEHGWYGTALGRVTMAG